MRALLLVAALLASGIANAQVRTIPPDAKRAAIRQVEGALVELDGERGMLAPGAQIRDQDNRIVMPAALVPGSLVKYSVDEQGFVRRVWILTPEEAAARD